MSAIQFAAPTTPSNARQEAIRTRNSKRRRVNLACERCRTRKSRCDGKQPVCENCEKAKTDCVYREPAWQTRTQEDFEDERPEREDDDQRERGGPAKKQTLEERLAAMEERLRRFEGSQSPKKRKLPPEEPVTSSAGVAEGHGLTKDDASPGSVDAMGTVSFADEQDSAFFGPSSNIAFLGHVSKAIEATRDPSFSGRQTQIDSDAAILQASRPSRHVSPRTVPERDVPDPFTLPPEAELIELAQQFFSNTGLLFPYVHADSFFEAYAQFKTQNPRNVRLSWLALCNMMLANAVSSSMDESLLIRHRVEKAESFFTRAVALSRKVDDHGTSLEEVQYLLLTTQYLQGTQRSVQTYAVHGRAVRAALSLGLQSSDALRRFSPLDQEMRKRTWYACVMIDRNLSMTFGRPPSIPDLYVKLPLPTTIRSAHGIPMGMPAQPNVFKSYGLNFFNATIDLYKIMSRVLESMYGQNLGCGDNESVGAMLSHIPVFEEDLSAWSRRADEAMRDDSLSPRETQTFDAAITRLRTILHLRLLNLRTLLHRPLLQKLLAACYSPSECRVDQYSHLMPHVWSSVDSCFRAAREIIDIIHSKSRYKAALGAWWYSLYYTFNCALIVLGVYLVSVSPNVEGSTNNLMEVPHILEQAVEALGYLDRGNHMIERCRVYLQKLLQTCFAVHMVGSRNGTSESPSYEVTQTQAMAPHQIQIQMPPAEHLTQYGGFSGPYDPSHLSTMEAFSDVGDLDLGPFMMNGSPEFPSYFVDAQMYSQAPQS